MPKSATSERTRQNRNEKNHSNEKYIQIGISTRPNIADSAHILQAAMNTKINEQISPHTAPPNATTTLASNTVMALQRKQIVIHQIATSNLNNTSYDLCVYVYAEEQHLCGSSRPSIAQTPPHHVTTDKTSKIL